MNASDVLKWGDDFLDRCLDGVPDEEWETPNVCGVWSVKQIVAHLASFELILTDALNPFVEVEAQPTYLQRLGADHQRFNDDEVAARDHMSPQEVLKEYKAHHAQNMELIARIPDTRLREVAAIPWYGPEYSLDDLIVYQYYGHKREHGAQINVFKDLLKERVNSQQAS